MIKKIFAFVSEKLILMVNRRSKMKKKQNKNDIALNISKNFTIIFDHQYDLIEANN